MNQDIEQQIVKFMRGEVPKGHFEHRVREIADGTGAGYNSVGKALASLVAKEIVKYRERTRRRIPYYYLAEVLDLVRKAWAEENVEDEIQNVLGEHVEGLART